MEFLVKDISHLVEMLKQVKLVKNTNTRLVKADIKDLFMSGEQPELTRIGGTAVHGFAHEAFTEALEFLIGSQYVRLEDKSIWQVIVGSGMGLTVQR